MTRIEVVLKDGLKEEDIKATLTLIKLLTTVDKIQNEEDILNKGIRVHDCIELGKVVDHLNSDIPMKGCMKLNQWSFKAELSGNSVYIVTTLQNCKNCHSKKRGEMIQNWLSYVQLKGQVYYIKYQSSALNRDIFAVYRKV